MRPFLAVPPLALASSLVAAALAAQPTDREQASLVLRLIPAQARAHATVILRNPTDDRIVRAGDGPFVCVSDSSPARRLSLVCHHRVLEERLRMERELRKETGLKGAAFTARLCHEVGARGLEVPNGAMEITASVGIAADGSLDPTTTVYRLLWLPLATAASAGVPSEDPGEGRPWLHQAGSCGAHVMWSEPIATAGDESP